MAENNKDSGPKAPETIIVPNKQQPGEFVERHKGAVYETVDTLPPPPPLPQKPDKE